MTAVSSRLSGSGCVLVELLPVHPVGAAVFLPGGVVGASVRSVRLRFRNPGGERNTAEIVVLILLSQLDLPAVIRQNQTL